MGNGSRARGIGVIQQVQEAPALTVNQFIKGVCEDWFVSQSAFVANILFREITWPPYLKDSISLRALLVFIAFGVANAYEKCTVRHCRSKARLYEYRPGSFMWMCASAGQPHMREYITLPGELKGIGPLSWMPFLNLVNMLRLGRANTEIIDELTTAYGAISSKTIRGWRRSIQGTLKIGLDLLDGLAIGGKDDVVVIDESVVGFHPGDTATVSRGIRKAHPQVRRTSRKTRAVKQRILQRFPARTIWKKPTANQKRFVVKKRPAAKKNASDRRSSGRWLWAAVSVGNGSTLYTHANGLKRFTFAWLPKQEDAPRGKPRGLDSIKNVINSRVVRGSFLVFDAWRSTVSAVPQLGFKHAPPVNHSKGFRERTKGFHSNDIESEFSRLKTWSRHRYGKLQLADLDLCEYTYYINMGQRWKG